MPPNRFESEVESFLEGSHGDRTHIKRADHPRLHHYAGRYSVMKAITKEIGIRSERLPRLLREPRVRLRRQSPSLEETTEMQIRHR